MQRRQFLKHSLVTTGAIAGGIVGVGSATFLLIDDINPNELTIKAALEKLTRLSTKELAYTGKWDLVQIFTHCAQSVDYSISGYPEHKSAWFKNTAGRVAFSLFSAKGRMTHSLDEAIPGAPIIAFENNSADKVNKALKNLQQSLFNFDLYRGQLAPHFAYGELTKRDYEIAHVMHCYNHLNEVIF